MMTGEHAPVSKGIEAQVYAGTTNHDGVIQIKINQLGSHTLINQIVTLQHKALASRPKLAQITDKIARWFVAAILLVAAITSVVWYQIDPENAFWISVSVLVATCPCALSLAIPTALTCSVANLTQKGLLIKKSHVLETVTKIDVVAFDKTGTLTEGCFTIKQAHFFTNDYDEAMLLALAWALESNSEHPIARAFKPEIPGAGTQVQGLTNVKVKTGYGVQADYLYTQQSTQQQLRLKVAIGKNAWFESVALPVQTVLYINEKAVAAFELEDKIRANSESLIRYLQRNDQQSGRHKKITTHLLTGDSSDSGPELAKQLGINLVETGCLPEQKQIYVSRLIKQGRVVAMLGDGVNDSPVFNTAHLSIAMESGADISKNTADVVLLNSDLNGIKHLFEISHKTRTIVTQNLALSLAYNSAIVPLAVMGMLAPWMAVIGMSASSIIVITNSLRLLK